MDSIVLQKIKFEFDEFKHNWRKDVFEWEFGQIEKVWIEAYENGEIRIGRVGGIRDM